jgi:AbrB family looped-hinge helix DNA binding protein
MWARVLDRILDEALDGWDDGGMAKVTGKFQITLPKAVVDECGIRVGDELELRSIGGSIHIDRRAPATMTRRRQERLAHFDRATARQQARQAAKPVAPARSRGWTREELYVRGRAR